MSERDHVLPPGLPAPVPMRDGLDAPFWAATRRNELVVQRCNDCGGWQWGPEWNCHHCLGFDVGWTEVEATGVIYSWERPWYPVHRQRFPSSARRMVVSVGCGSRRSNPTSVTKIPGVQNPHWRPPCSASNVATRRATGSSRNSR